MMMDFVTYLIVLILVHTGSSQSAPRDYRQMIMDLEGSVHVSGKNAIYQYNTTDLSDEVASLPVGPYNNTDVYVTQLYYTPGTSEYSSSLMFCLSSDHSCYFTNPADLSDYNNGTLHITSDRATAVFTAGIWYLACPHQHTYFSQGYSPCSDPGIFKMSRQNKVTDQVKFKKTNIGETVKTTKFIRGLEFGDSKLFFSVQDAGSDQTSHVTHICESSSQMMGTYIEMPITCGTNNILVDVKKESAMFVASFTNTQRQGSTVCIYSIVQTKIRLIDNMAKCYRGEYQYSTNNDYIQDSRCNNQNSPVNVLMNRSESTILCNLDGFHQTYYGVIGDIRLYAQPALEFRDQVISGITLAKRADLITAFLGSELMISKAVIYPTSKTADKLESVYPVYGLLPGQLLNDGTNLYALTASQAVIYPTSKTADKLESVYPVYGLLPGQLLNDGTNLYALTASKVFKFPMSNCTSKSTCHECVSDPDPDCGWCILGNMCTSNEACTDSHIWLKASSNTVDKCPRVSRIQPDIINVKNTAQNLTIHIQPEIDVSNFELKCEFTSIQPQLSFTKLEPATGQSGLVQCRELFQEVRNLQERIKGTLNVDVSVYLAYSDQPLVTSTITYYNCNTFTRCMSCVNTSLSCNWCPYGGRVYCVDRGEVCDTPNLLINTTSQCPTMRTFRFTDDLEDDNGTLVISQDVYNLTVTGNNFPPPGGSLQYSCVSTIQRDLTFRADYMDSTTLQCTIDLRDQTIETGTLNTNIAVMSGDTYLDGSVQNVIFYDCKSLVSPRNNCGECQSFQFYKPQYKCQWCAGTCQYAEKSCNIEPDQTCPPPVIENVYPLNASINASTRIDISGYNLGSHYNDTVNTVTIAQLMCRSIEDMYIPSKRISCIVGPADAPREGDVLVAMGTPLVTSGYPGHTFSFKEPQLRSVCPQFGPRSGGTRLYVYGTNLHIGRDKQASVAGLICNPVDCVKNSTCYNHGESADLFCCETCSANQSLINTPQNFELNLDGQSLQDSSVTYEYAPDPIIQSISPRESFADGGRMLTITGQNLMAIQEPKIYLRFSTRRKRVISYPCTKNETVNRPGTQKIYCPSPPRRNRGDKIMRRGKRSIQNTIIAFEMDGVQTVKHLSPDLASITYYNNPTIKKFDPPEKYQKVLIIEGENLTTAATLDDVTVWIGSSIKCNVTLLEKTKIYFNPPENPPTVVKDHPAYFQVQVDIGYFTSDAGFIKYGATSPSDHTTAIIVGLVAAAVFVGLTGLAIFCYVRKKRSWGEQRKSLEYMMEMKEAKFREQCRKEFAGLQTAMSDLTSDLAGGNVLFRDYNVYASNVLFTTNRDHVIMQPPPVRTESSNQAMDSFKSLLKTTQFLLVMIRTLDKEKRFTIQDKSNVASILMALNHDNMEYITEILKTLLNDLVDKNVAAMSEKLLLRRSECVAEKLLTHWLSICLYDYLKERAGTPLFQLYKAIKVQVERGPVDYISGCATFTLSEDKLLAEDINPNSLTIHVTHEDYTDNVEKTITLTVLDCDTITQTKSKLLEVFYKNVGYSQRPLVHSTKLEWVEEDSTSRVLSDEDPSSVKDGIWKRINTLGYYKVQDGAKMRLVHSRKDGTDDLLKTAAATGNPDAFIGSFKRTKQVVRTVSGSNFWHLAKQHQADEDEENSKLVSDLLLPRLLVMKGTLQTYIDDLITEILCTTQDPPIIIKYLYDFLDSAAEEHSITDPEVLHTWKCNSLLLRFWVNIMKNPEFVFDIFKPHIVDKCLSVVAQAFMDSCSTVDVKLAPSSPSNKLLFAKEIPRYKTQVKDYFQYVKEKPAVSDQELNSFFTDKVSMKFSGDFHQSSAVMEMYKYASTYRGAIESELDNLEAESPGHYSPMISKMQLVYMMMDREGGASK